VALCAYNIDAQVQSHLNIYCNGERRLSLGYDAADDQQFPRAITAGQDQSSDLWQAVVVEALVDQNGTMTDCIITPVHAAVADPALDGSTDFCVDTDPQGGASIGSSEWLFQPGGAYPAGANGVCWH
jgi:hypothetical protein